MTLSSREILRRLGAGEPIATVAAAAGCTRAELDAWWAREAAARVPATEGTRRVPGGVRAEIQRDGWGVPNVYAEREADLFFAYGYAMAQDRLFQLDWLRRKASGTLAEVLGPEGLELDTIARTVGFRRIAEAEWARTPAETRTLLEAFAAGIDAAIEAAGDRRPIEFDLLDYAPAPWSPVDSLAIAGELRYYLTVRFPVIAIPELARRALGEGALYQAFLQGEADDESILPPGAYPAARSGADPVGPVIGWPAGGGPEDGGGSNNWVVAGARSASGRPMVASDPHIAFGAVSCWYEAHLAGGAFNVVGTGYAGVPGIIFGRTERVAWGVTNNICSQRDLYQERTDPAHPGCFLHDGRWEPARELVEEIRVRGAAPVRTVIRFSRNGPIVDALLPAAARHTGPVALRWLGATPCEWIPALLRMNRARSAEEFRAALRGWRVPTWSLVFGDVDGHIGYQAVGTIPIRRVPERAYRPGWDPRHQWDGLVPFEGMPRWADPPRGWITTANNRPAPEDFPYPLAGTWSSGHRARRIRQMLEATPVCSREDFARMHQDVLSLRALEAVPRLRETLAGIPVTGSPRVAEALRHLEAWDGRMEVDRVGAAIFEAFFHRFCRAVADERFPPDQAELVAGAIAGLATELLGEDKLGWFTRRTREAVVLAAFEATLEDLASRLGPDAAGWTWGRLHQIRLQHVLSTRGELGQLLDRGGLPVKGNGVTVCNTGYDPNYLAPLGANYRLIADLATSPPGLWAVDAQGQSGHPGSPHYGDQLAEWIAGRYHYLSLDRAEAAKTAVHTLRLEPGGR
jgi:penicillin amidase